MNFWETYWDLTNKRSFRVLRFFSPFYLLECYACYVFVKAFGFLAILFLLGEPHTHKGKQLRKFALRSSPAAKTMK